uniref:Uncharacterized protein n=1 Tax=Arundo donax TaxID=35708 RepID=A0A0A8ZXS8_ARUDO
MLPLLYHGHLNHLNQIQLVQI